MFKNTHMVNMVNNGLLSGSKTCMGCVLEIMSLFLLILVTERNIKARVCALFLSVLGLFSRLA